jgi:single-stranded DNA-binding protein
MNNIAITLTLTARPETKRIGEKLLVHAEGRFSQGKDKDGNWKPSIFFDIDAWENSFGWASKNLAALDEDDLVVVSGELAKREYIDKNGEKREKLAIRATTVEQVQRIGRAPARPAPPRERERPQPAPPRAPPPPVDDDEIPF